jgi:hypothetical protein
VGLVVGVEAHKHEHVRIHIHLVVERAVLVHLSELVLTTRLVFLRFVLFHHIHLGHRAVRLVEGVLKPEQIIVATPIRSHATSNPAQFLVPQAVGLHAVRLVEEAHSQRQTVVVSPQHNPATPKPASLHLTIP